jgi:hypothetical protein
MGQTMQRYGKRHGPDDLISAAEIACFAYCPEQWRLQYGQGLPAENQAALDAGTRHHERKAVAERLAGGAIDLGRFLAVLAVVALLLWLWWRS